MEFVDPRDLFHIERPSNSQQIHISTSSSFSTENYSPKQHYHNLNTSPSEDLESFGSDFPIALEFDPILDFDLHFDLGFDLALKAQYEDLDPLAASSNDGSSAGFITPPNLTSSTATTSILQSAPSLGVDLISCEFHGCLRSFTRRHAYK